MISQSWKKNPMATPEWLPANAEPPNRFPPLSLTNHTPIGVCQGGMGLVYFCETHDERVAVKVLRPEIAMRPNAAQNFLRECYLWLSLGESPNIVPARSAHMRQFEPPIVISEFMPTSLRERLAVLLSAPELIRLVHALISGLDYARSTVPGFIHGDLKPENIMLDDQGTARISDFGLARSVVVAAISVADSASNSESAAESAVRLVGTPLYMAPEQIHGTINEASDIYAIGCVLHESATGRPVYGPPASVSDYLLRHLYGTPENLRTSRADLPIDLVDLIAACLHKESAQRPSLPDIAGELKRVADRLGVPLAHHSGKAKAGPRLSAAKGLQNIGAHEEAIMLLTRSSAKPESDHETAMSSLILAASYNSMGQHSEAHQELDRIKKLASANEGALRDAYLNERGRAHVASGTPEGKAMALKYFTAAARNTTANSMAWANLAKIRDELGDRRGAVTALFTASNIAGDLAYFTQLVMWLAPEPMGEIEATQVAEVAVHMHPANPTAYFTRAFAVSLNLFREPDKASDEILRRLVTDFDIARRGGTDPEQISTLREIITSLFTRLGYATDYPF
jgi:serine/threonine protein kinase